MKTKLPSDVVELPGGKIVPLVMIDDLKATWPRDEKTNKWIAPWFEDQSFIGKDDKKCPNCGGPEGRGVLLAPTGDKRKHGGTWFGGEYIERQLVAYNCPVCSVGARTSRLVDLCGLPNFAGMDTAVWEQPGRETMIEPFFAMQSEWTTSATPHGWASIVGPLDSGKTTLAMILTHNLVAARREARYAIAADLVDTAFRAIRADEQEPVDALKPWYDVPYLMLDEIFLVRQINRSGELNFGVDHLIRLLDHRYRNRHRLATCVVLDSDWIKIEQDGDRLNIQPNLEIAENMGLVLSRAMESDWMCWTTLTGFRAMLGNKKRAGK